MNAVRGTFCCILFSIVTLGPIFPNDASGADIYVKKPRLSSTGEMIDEGLAIDGEISSGDYDAMIGAIKDAGRIPGFIQISSAGGDVVEAMKIGQFVRDSLMSVIAGSKQEWDSPICNSSCFLILAAGTKRYPDIPVGIHRPYYNREYFAGLSPTDAEKKYKELDSIVRDYLVRMDVPPQVIHRMMSIKSTDLEFLSYGEIAIQWNAAPALEEWLIAKCGTLSDSESFDVGAISAASNAESFRNMMSDESDPKERAKLRSYVEEAEPFIRHASRLSDGYKSYLLEKSQKTYRCKETAEEDHRQEMFNKL